MSAGLQQDNAEGFATAHARLPGRPIIDRRTRWAKSRCRPLCTHWVLIGDRGDCGEHRLKLMAAAIDAGLDIFGLQLLVEGLCDRIGIPSPRPVDQRLLCLAVGGLVDSFDCSSDVKALTTPAEAKAISALQNVFDGYRLLPYAFWCYGSRRVDSPIRLRRAISRTSVPETGPSNSTNAIDPVQFETCSFPCWKYSRSGRGQALSLSPSETTDSHATREDNRQRHARFGNRGWG